MQMLFDILFSVTVFIWAYWYFSKPLRFELRKQKHQKKLHALYKRIELLEIKNQKMDEELEKLLSE